MDGNVIQVPQNPQNMPENHSQVFFTVNVGEIDGTCADVRLIEGVRLIWG